MIYLINFLEKYIIIIIIDRINFSNMVLNIFGGSGGRAVNFTAIFNKINSLISKNTDQDNNITDLQTKQDLLTEYPKIQNSSNAIVGNNEELVRGSQAVDLQLFRANNARVAVGAQSALVGGRNSQVSSVASGIFCGENNLIGSSILRSVILGGDRNICNVTQGGVICGQDNKLLIGATDSGILGGKNAEISYGFKCVVIGGNNPLIRGISDGVSNECAIISGSGNKILQSSSRSVVAGGLDNKIEFSEDSIIAGGTLNEVKSGSRYSIINGGFQNEIQNSTMAFVSGTLNKIEGGILTAHSNEASILSGSLNNIQGSSPRATIIGGISNYMSQAPDGAIIGCNNSSCRSPNGFLAGGLSCILQTGCDRSAIVSGEQNQIYSASNSVCLGGNDNIVDGRGTGSISSSFAIGRNNTISHSNTIVLSGRVNSVNSSYNDEIVLDANSIRTNDQKRTVNFSKLYAPGLNISNHLNGTDIPIQKTASVFIKLWYAPSQDGSNTSSLPGFIEEKFIAWRKPDGSFLESDSIQEWPANIDGVKIAVSILSNKLWLTTTTPNSTNEWLCKFEIDYFYDIINDYLEP